jgi:hypothetical protein
MTDAVRRAPQGIPSIQALSSSKSHLPVSMGWCWNIAASRVFGWIEISADIRTWTIFFAHVVRYLAADGIRQSRSNIAGDTQCAASD